MADIRKFLDSTGLAALWKKIVAADEAVKTGLETKISGVKEKVDALHNYDDTAIKASIKANTDALITLNSDETVEGSIKKIASAIAAEKVAAIVNNAPESFDTLKEIADWIATHSTDAANLIALTARMTTVEGKIKTLEGASHSHDNKAVLDGVTTEKVAAWDAAETNAKGYTDAEIAKIQAYTKAEVEKV